jgi:hypothetical protein
MTSAAKKEKLAPWREPEHAKGHITGALEIEIDEIGCC